MYGKSKVPVRRDALVASEPGWPGWGLGEERFSSLEYVNFYRKQPVPRDSGNGPEQASNGRGGDGVMSLRSEHA